MMTQNLDVEVMPSVHPLLMDHVAKKIFSFIDWSHLNSDILSIRKVCKIWYHIITNRMKRKELAPTIIFDLGDTVKMENFLEDMYDSLNLPFDSFQFEPNFFIKSNSGCFTNFTSSFSPFIRTISISIGTQYLLNLLPENLDFSDFCSLKSLTFQCFHKSILQDSTPSSQELVPSNQSDGVFILLKAILSSAKQLEKFEFHLPARYFTGHLTKDTNFKFADLIASELSDSVTNLKVTMEIDHHQLTRIKRLKLRTLHLNYYGSQLSDSNLADYLNSQRSSLIELKIADLENPANCNRFPEFPKLKVLELKETRDKSCLACLKYFPVLEKFVWKNCRNSLSQPGIVGDFQYPKVRDIELTYPISEYDNQVWKIPRYFPNIKALRIQCNPNPDQIMEAVFTSIPELEELQLTFSSNCCNQLIDHILTGMSPRLCQQIKGNILYSLEHQTIVLNQLNARRAGLDQLKKLKKLIIQAEPNSIILTDVAVYYALFRLPFLCEVILGSHNISFECLRLMKARMTVTETIPTLNDASCSSNSMSMALVCI